jgi:putative membrane protein
MPPGDGDSVRTGLAVERTMLAWWRTGLAALAVALGIGRILPVLDPDAENWPYVAVGLGFALYAIGLFGYGTVRGVTDGVRPPRAVQLVAAGGTLLAIATGLLILLA